MALIAVLNSCNISETASRLDGQNQQKLVFSAPSFVEDNGLETRATIRPGEGFVWSANDTLGIYPNSGSQVFFAIDGGGGTSSAEFDGGGWDFKPSTVYRSYYPYICKVHLNADDIPVNYSGQRQTGNDNSDGIGPFCHMYTPATTASDGTLNMSFSHLSIVIKPKISLPAGNYTKLTLTLDEPLFVIKGHYDLTADNPEIIGDTFSNTISMDLDISLESNSQLIAYIMCAPLDMSGKTLIISITSNEGVTYEVHRSIAKPYSAGTIYTLTDNASESSSQPLNQIRYNKRYDNAEVNYHPDGTTGNVVTSKYTVINGGTRYHVIEFSKPLTTIDASAFDGESNLASVTLPESVEIIGDKAFNSCSYLTEVNLGGNVKHIGKDAFMNCAFEEIELPEVLESIDDGAFRNCCNLTTISLPESLKEIGSGIFEASSYIECFEGDCEFVYDDRHIIDGDRLVAYAMGGLGDYGTYTEEVPSEVKFIDKGAYSGATSLGEIILPEGLEEIGPSAFAQCFYLKSITIPASVSKIHYDAFSECEERIEWIKICRTESAITAVSHNGYFGAFDNTNDCPIYVPINTLNWYKYGQYWEEYGSSLGENNRYRILASDNEILYTTTDGNAVTLPSSLSSTVTNIAPKDNGGVGVLRSTSDWTSIPSYSFDIYENPGAIILETVIIPDKVKTIGIASFRGCSNLKNVDFGNGVETIAEQAFSSCGLTTLNLPDNVSRIMANAFSHNNELTTVRIPGSLESNAIGSNPFNSCMSLRSFTGDNPIVSENGMYLVRDDGTMVSYACAATYGVFTIPESVTVIGENAMAGSAFQGVKMLSMTPPALHFTAFSGIDAYTIQIPDAAIDDYASASVWSSIEIKSHFVYYQSNRSIWYTTNGGNMLDIPSTLPSGCELVSHGYTSGPLGHGVMIFSKEVTDIPYRMFLNANNNNDGKALKTVSLPEEVLVVGSMAFGNCYSLESVSFGNKITTIEASAFYQCDLQSLTLPESITRLNAYAFQGNKHLTSVALPSSINYLGTNPFADCVALTSFTGSSTFITSNGRCLAKDGHLISFAAATTGPFQIPSGITSIDTYAMSQASISSITFLSDLNTIGDDAMISCPNLTSLTIPASVTSIGRYAFAYCPNLTSVTMEGTTPPTLGDSAFIDNGNPQPLMPVGCKLWIPEIASDAYLAATNWSALSGYFDYY